MAQPSTTDPPVNSQLFSPHDFSGACTPAQPAQSSETKQELGQHSKFSPGGGLEGQPDSGPGLVSQGEEPGPEFSPGGGLETGLSSEPSRVSKPEGEGPEFSPGGGDKPDSLLGLARDAAIDRASAALLARETSPATQLVALWLVACGGSWEGPDEDSLLVQDETLSLRDFGVGVNCLAQAGLATYRREAGVLSIAWRGAFVAQGVCEHFATPRLSPSLSLPSLPLPSPQTPHPTPTYLSLSYSLSTPTIRKGLKAEPAPCGSAQSLRPAGCGSDSLVSSLSLQASAQKASVQKAENAETSLTNIKPEELTREELEVRISGQPLQETLPGVSRAKPPELRRARKKSHPLYEQTRKLVVLWAARSGRDEVEEAKRVTPFRMKLVRERLAEGYDWPALARAVSGVAYSPWRKKNGADQIEKALMAGRVDQAIAEWERFAPIQKVLEYSEQFGRVPPSREEELAEYLAAKGRGQRKRREDRRFEREIAELRAQREAEAEAKEAQEALELEFWAEELAEAEEERKRRQLPAAATTEDQGRGDE